MENENIETAVAVPESVHGRLNREHGAAIELGQGSALYINQPRLAAGFAADNFIKYDLKRGFMEFDEGTGLWNRLIREVLKLRIAAYLRDYAVRDEYRGLQRKITNDLLDDLADLVQGFAFTEFEANPFPGVIHLTNCMLDTNVEPFVPIEFSPDFLSTRRLPFTYDATATCPRYLRWLDETMDHHDQILWTKWAGMVLSGLNSAQRILILSGIGGSSKGQLVRLICDLLGAGNCLEFRTRQLGQRFEMGKLIDKTLLIGSDVSANFLSEAAAHYLKSLTGEDPISAELKNVNGSVLLTGEYNVVMTSNTKLRVRLEGDLEAWRRRLMMISFTKEVENQVPNFAKSILRAEASGVLNHMLGGLAALRREGFTLTRDQKARVEDLLGESDSVRTFVQTQVKLDPEGDATTDEIVRAHERYCQRHGWVARSSAVVEKEVHKAIHELYGISPRHDLLRGGTAKRGFSGFVIAPEPYESDAM